MEIKLEPTEKKCLEEFVKSSGRPILPLKYSFFVGAVISLAGLSLFVSAVVITLNNLTDRTAYWILLPGMTCGIIAMVLGNFLFGYMRKYKKTERVVKIIKKLLI